MANTGAILIAQKAEASVEDATYKASLSIQDLVSFNCFSCEENKETICLLANSLPI